MSGPITSPSDSFWCRVCRIHRTTTPARLCPVCDDDAKRAEPCRS